MFVNSGFEDEKTEKWDMIFNFKSAEEFTNFVCETASTVQVILSTQSEVRKK
ncbi:MAG TPA: hypothetical protein VFG45_05015 [Candidatus Nitrosocosmicus sp.]|uniref:hypothetical protein n=1 Tax=Candidatus Nitrosocosmicus agrestis TaxID=2563600 RepID=UPI0012B62DEE|nr:hypothetical protein [Candidatus Nitrosocosmicus sp. SS]HET6589507.1 hypothetical protein [Candidatus Nitrosocosmicus sp.]